MQEPEPCLRAPYFCQTFAYFLKISNITSGEGCACQGMGQQCTFILSQLLLGSGDLNLSY